MNKNFLFPTSMTFLNRKCNYVYDHRAQRGGRPALALSICGRGGTRPRARFAADASKLLSALLAHPRLLTGLQRSPSSPTPSRNV